MKTAIKYAVMAIAVALVACQALAQEVVPTPEPAGTGNVEARSDTNAGDQAHSSAAANAPVDQAANRWRYRWFDGHWWYWTAQNRWMWYNDEGRWIAYQPAPRRRQSNKPSHPAHAGLRFSVLPALWIRTLLSWLWVLERLLSGRRGRGMAVRQRGRQCGAARRGRRCGASRSGARWQDLHRLVKYMKIVRVMLMLLVGGLLVAVGPFASVAKGDVLCTIPVKILVDQKEMTTQQVWEKRYRDRVAAASEIFERTCGVRFKVVAVGTWTVRRQARDLQFVADFEQKVNPAPARLAIGFTGQYYKLREDIRIGGTNGPFRTNILISEWGHDVTDPERLEILVHELGHFMGAVHSSEHQSVMRPDLSDRQSRMRDFHVSFDTRNATAMRLVAAEFAKRPLFALGQLPPASKEN